MKKNFSILLLGLSAALILQALGSSFLGSYYQSILIYAGINIILAVSLNIVNGITGQFSLGHAGFMSIGAYTSAYVSMNYFGSLNSLPLSLIHI